jgi:hypothetical protein
MVGMNYILCMSWQEAMWGEGGDSFLFGPRTVSLGKEGVGDSPSLLSAYIGLGRSALPGMCAFNLEVKAKALKSRARDRGDGRGGGQGGGRGGLLVSMQCSLGGEIPSSKNHGDDSGLCDYLAFKFCSSFQSEPLSPPLGRSWDCLHTVPLHKLISVNSGIRLHPNLADF